MTSDFHRKYSGKHNENFNEILRKFSIRPTSQNQRATCQKQLQRVRRTKTDKQRDARAERDDASVVYLGGGRWRFDVGAVIQPPQHNRFLLLNLSVRTTRRRNLATLIQSDLETTWPNIIRPHQPPHYVTADVIIQQQKRIQNVSGTRGRHRGLLAIHRWRVTLIGDVPTSSCPAWSVCFIIRNDIWVIAVISFLCCTNLVQQKLGIFFLTFVCF